MKDYIVRASACDGMIRAFCCTTKNMLEYAKEAHKTSPVVTAALGRLLSAGAMMGIMLKGEKDLVTLKVQGSGPVKSIIVTADSKGNVKGYPEVPVVDIGKNEKGKLDVASAVGIGLLTVIRDTGLKEPYVGTVELISSEIAEDLTYYYAKSEQIPSSVALGVLMNKDNTVKASGGFIIQLMPGASEEVIIKLEEKLKNLAPISSLLSEKTPEEILDLVLGEFGLNINKVDETAFFCDCGKEKIKKALISLGKKEIENIINDGESINVNCHFCDKNHEFNLEELKEILEKARK